ncbi:hypothetical protein B0H13DRAFT_1853330 [Mycena leptocephala]|nr:hypothetical protein B0H13DRAFT_1853330 [Mycena leptocephala]
MCMRHPEWEATIASIRQLGGKAGEDWIEDKIRSKFTLEGWCWEKSHIPEAVCNLVESVHADVDREGVKCTLLGGLKKGQAFDAQKMKTLEMYGITKTSAEWTIRSPRTMRKLGRLLICGNRPARKRTSLGQY